VVENSVVIIILCSLVQMVRRVYYNIIYNFGFCVRVRDQSTTNAHVPAKQINNNNNIMCEYTKLIISIVVNRKLVLSYARF